ncbi:MAG: PilZ domain-containing protein [Deltaproteobacteria bacterium]|nr:PilZ domain-containing protein [Deltaproteobacteria bacterium]MBI2500703.1 PilZ domain-containing protein [Deltaproteobacteria bacterium]MBI4196199.1 PilZ domain-containing protein [Deltaproteobacteria bacterium]
MNFPGSEKRLFPRKKLRTRVVFEDETGEGFIYFYSVDVSVGGVYFESDVPLKLGTKVFLSFLLGEGGPMIRSTGQVVRVERETGSGFLVLGVGIKFVDISEASRKLIDQYVSV